MPSASAAYSVTAAPSIAAVQAGYALDEMRSLLRKNRPSTTAEALRLLRQAFPAAPLRLRIAACEG